MGAAEAVDRGRPLPADYDAAMKGKPRLYVGDRGNDISRASHAPIEPK